MTTVTCQISGEPFFISEAEKKLREKLGVGDGYPMIAPRYRFRELGAFWPHWNLHPRTCDMTGEAIVSVFRPDCPYPVWEREQWAEHSNPPISEMDFNRDFFSQALKLFTKSPIPHKTGTGNENCEYTDDWWYSKNCYLCHSGIGDEDARYSYRLIDSTEVHYAVFSFKCELCIDLTNCHNCFEVRYAVNCRNLQNCSFVYDCRNCTDCMFSFNLRNKQYCFGNQQLTKEAYEEKIKEWDFASRSKYEIAKQHFKHMMVSMAWHRDQYIDQSEECTGDYIEKSKNLAETFFTSEAEDNINQLRGHDFKDCLDTISTYESELCYCSSMCQIRCYQARFNFNVSECQYTDYCGYCFQCEHCFGCCGLVGKKYCIFNKQYTEKEYKVEKEKIITHMKKTGEWGKFFPGSFAPNPYEESLSGYHFPLTKAEQRQARFYVAPKLDRKPRSVSLIKDIPDRADQEKKEDLTDKIFWDEKFERPFQIQKADIQFSEKLKCPLPNSYYMRRIQENFDWMPFSGSLRKTKCAKSGKDIETSWPEDYDGRILCEEEYLKVVG